MTAMLVMWLLAADAGEGPACKTVDDCWIDNQGQAIARPKSKKGHKIPRGDCGKNILWLRTKLTCEEGVCKAENVGDKC